MFRKMADRFEFENRSDTAEFLLKMNFIVSLKIS